jgi:hypothetical protein
MPPGQAFNFLSWVRRAEGIPTVGEKGGRAFTNALLEVEGHSFFATEGALGFARPPGVLFQTMRHAEGNVFGKAAEFGVRGGHGHPYVDQLPCAFCHNSLGILMADIKIEVRTLKGVGEPTLEVREEPIASSPTQSRQHCVASTVPASPS